MQTFVFWMRRKSPTLNSHNPRSSKANPMSTTFTSDDDSVTQISDLITNRKIVRRSSMRLSLRRLSVRESLAANKAVSTKDEAANDTITPTSTQSAESIDKAYDKTSLRGAPNGLFRSCMGAIKSSHRDAREIRTALILLCLFTDKNLYRDWLTVFYAINHELEAKMQSGAFECSQEQKQRRILLAIKQLGSEYYFDELYEKDLGALYGTTKFTKHVESCLEDKPNAVKFRNHIRNITNSSELAGALFCLWGVFIVGGGATARQRAKALCGDSALNVYQKVAGPGREQRKLHFINFWDDCLVTSGESEEAATIIQSAETCMKMMNDTMKDLSANPWWLQWLSRLAVLTTSVFIAVGWSYYCRNIY